VTRLLKIEYKGVALEKMWQQEYFDLKKKEVEDKKKEILERKNKVKFSSVRIMLTILIR